MRRLILCLGESEPSSGSPTDCEPTALPADGHVLEEFDAKW
jgi:hypothetical protein